MKWLKHVLGILVHKASSSSGLGTCRRSVIEGRWKKDKENSNKDMDPPLWQACANVRVEEQRPRWSACGQSLQGILGFCGVLWAHTGLGTRCQAPKRAELGCFWAGPGAGRSEAELPPLCVIHSLDHYSESRLLALRSTTSFRSVVGACGNCGGSRATEAASQTKPRWGEASQALKSCSLNSWFCYTPLGDCGQTTELFLCLSLLIHITE